MPRLDLEMVSLGAVLSYLSATAETDLHHWLVRIVGYWAWDYVAQPMISSVAGLAAVGVSGPHLRGRGAVLARG